MLDQVREAIERLGGDLYALVAAPQLARRHVEAEVREAVMRRLHRPRVARVARRGSARGDVRAADEADRVEAWCRGRERVAQVVELLRDRGDLVLAHRRIDLRERGEARLFRVEFALRGGE